LQDNNVHSFPNRRTTYQPSFVSESALRAFGRGDYDKIRTEIRAAAPDSYERVSVDRALAIALDLALQGVDPTSSILDIGCAEGLVSALLSRIGYRVVGIDNDLVAEVQPWYDLEVRSQSRSSLDDENCEYLRAEALDYLKAPGPAFDVILVLSVLHHFLKGYGLSGNGAISNEEFSMFLRLLCGRAKRFLYVEVPIFDEEREIPGDSNFPIPQYFVSNGLAAGFDLIASTVATNAKPRRLYRINL
jgi:SAM-dependent methyltransferase